VFLTDKERRREKNRSIKRKEWMNKDFEHEPEMDYAEEWEKEKIKFAD